MDNTSRMRKAPSNLVHCDPWHIAYLAELARPDEIAQFQALGESGSLADYCNSRQGPKFTVLANGMPIAAGGYFLVDDRVWQSWQIGTLDGWKSHWRSITKASRWLIDAMLHVGARRLETYVLPTRKAACEWYVRSLHLVKENEGLYVRTIA